MTKTRSLLGNECWPFVPGKVNPADLATRHNFINDVMIKRWKDGSEFLLQREVIGLLKKIFMVFLQVLDLRRRRNQR